MADHVNTHGKYHNCFQHNENITNKDGHGLSVQFYATLATILVTKMDQETHLAIPIDPAINYFHHLSKTTEPSLGPEAFLPFSGGFAE